MTYQLPPAEILDLVDVSPTPGIMASPDQRHLLFLQRPSFPSIEEVARPELKLAGVRINPATNGPARTSYITGFTLRSLDNDSETEITGLPDQPLISHLLWSPDSRYCAFSLTHPDRLELWVLEAATATVRCLSAAPLNSTLLSRPFLWLDGGATIICARVVAGRPENPPVPAAAEIRPLVQESDGSAKTALRTYQDLLKTPADELLFDYYGSSQLVVLDLVSGTEVPYAEAGLIAEISPSPDSRYLRLGYIRQPYSYAVPYSRFPRRLVVLDRNGAVAKELPALPLRETRPQGFMATDAGPRSYGWRTDQAATIYWVEALDGGDPAQNIPFRDQLFLLPAPFIVSPEAGPKSVLRYSGVSWHSDGLALLYDYWFASRRAHVYRWQPGRPTREPQTVFDLDTEDHYANPGDFLTRSNEYGRQILHTDAGAQTAYLAGEGASPTGNRPFLDTYDLTTGTTVRCWQSAPDLLETPAFLRIGDPDQLLLRRESKEERGNFFLRRLSTGRERQVTYFPHPYPQLRQMQREDMHYQRADGLALQGKLHLPPGYDPARDGRLPVLLWAYPREYKNKEAAGQVKTSPHRFTYLYWASPLYWVARGFAVLDDVAMPVVGEADEEPNDTFIAQIRLNAEAAVAELDRRGIAQLDRIYVGGHSYGAFMTANLLAHTDLFAAGIARSGAFNRSLTPFGFQTEERYYWDAPDIYTEMSPFSHVDKIDAPLLLIHGQEDSNPGTFPLQSERMFAALRGLGKPSRLIMLPHEQHSYQARESILHMLWEIDQWLQHKKQAAPSPE